MSKGIDAVPPVQARILLHRRTILSCPRPHRSRASAPGRPLCALDYFEWVHVRLSQESEVVSTLKRSAVLQKPDRELGERETTERPHNVAFERIKRGGTMVRR
jgi:hypothetical protein